MPPLLLTSSFSKKEQVLLSDRCFPLSFDGIFSLCPPPFNFSHYATDH